MYETNLHHQDLIKTNVLAAGKNAITPFVDLKKATIYDSIDRDILITMLEEFGIDDKTKSRIQLTLKKHPIISKFLGD